MAEVYTLIDVGDTPVELTGGRVGSFKIYAVNQALRAGDATITPLSGMRMPAAEVFDLYVTSPDEIYIVSQLGTTDVRVFHNR